MTARAETPLPGPDAASVRRAMDASHRARARIGRARPHRALVHLGLGPYVVHALVLPALFIALLLHYEPLLVEFWRTAVIAMSDALALPLRPSARAASWGEVRLVWMHLEAPTMLPGNAALAVSAVITLVAFAATFFLPSRWIPLGYLVRVLCAVQGAATIFFAAGGALPYDIADHLLALSAAGFVMLATAPLMLALGYYVLRVPLAIKIAHTALILGYFILWVPVQMVAHAALLQHLTLVAMPLLYFFFGALLDFLLFVALYGWVASTAPEDATVRRAPVGHVLLRPRAAAPSMGQDHERAPLPHPGSRP